MKARALKQAKAAPRRAARGPQPDYAGDRSGLVRYLVEKGKQRGLHTADIARAMGISGEHLGNIRKGRTSTRNFAERWAQVLGVDLNDEAVMRELRDQAMAMLTYLTSDPQVSAQEKSILLDDLIRFFERETPVKLEPVFDFYDEVSVILEPRPYVIENLGDFPPVGSNHALSHRRR